MDDEMHCLQAYINQSIGSEGAFFFQWAPPYP